jgi:hypothetical protein
MIYLRLIRYHSLILLIFLILAIFLRSNSLSVFSTHYIGGTEEDAGLYIWLLTEAISSLKIDNWFNTTSFYPYQYNLAWSDNFLLPSLITYPFRKAQIPLPLIWNCLTIGIITLNGYFSWRLAKLISNNFATSFIAGVLLSSWGFLHEHAGHAQLQYAFFLPFGIELIIRHIRTGRVSYPIMSGINIAMAFMCSVYYAIFLNLIYSCSILYIIVTEKKINKKLIGLSLATIGIVPFIFVIFPYLKVGKSFGYRFLFESHFFSATILSYFAKSSLDLFLPYSSVLSHAEAHLSPGFIIIGLTLIALFIFVDKIILIIWLLGLLLSLYDKVVGAILLWLTLILFLIFIYKKPKRSEINFIFLIMFISLFVSLGPMGNIANNENTFGIFTILFYIFPGFDSLRAISRIGIVPIICSGIITSYLISLINSTYFKAIATFIICTIIVLENYQINIPLDAKPLQPEIYKNIKEPKTIILSLPFTDKVDSNNQVLSWSNFANLNVKSMLWSQEANLLTINGYSGLRTRYMLKLPGLTKNFPDKVSLKLLSGIIGLKYIILHSSKPFNKLNNQIKKLNNKIKLISIDNQNNYLFKLMDYSWNSKDHLFRFPASNGCFSAKISDLNSVNISLLQETTFLESLSFRKKLNDRYFFKIPNPINKVNPYGIRFYSYNPININSLKWIRNSNCS